MGKKRKRQDQQRRQLTPEQQRRVADVGRHVRQRFIELGGKSAAAAAAEEAIKREVRRRGIKTEADMEKFISQTLRTQQPKLYVEEPQQVNAATMSADEFAEHARSTYAFSVHGSN